MTLILADIIWPALFLEDRLLSVWVIGLGLFVEYFFVWRITSLGALKSLWADFVMNTASTLLGIPLVPFFGLVVALFPAWTFGPFIWTLTFVVTVLLNTCIE